MCNTCYLIKNELTTEEIKEIMDQVHEWDISVFNPLGGEPFVRKDIIKILKYARNLGLETSITTNGTLINNEIAAELARLNKVNMNFSVDGLEKRHDSIRGKGVFRKAVNAIKLIRKHEKELIKKAEESLKIETFHPKKITINCIIHDKNLNEILPLIEYVKRIGVNKIQFLTLFRHPGKKSDTLFVKKERFKELDKSIDRLVRYIKKDKSKFGYVNSIKDLELMKDYYKGNLKPKKVKCYNGLKELYINADGNVMMCNGKLDFLDGFAGNIRENNLKEIWKSKKAREMRKKVKKCKKACLQDCYLRRDSDSLLKILSGISKSFIYHNLKRSG
nr:radical SAM protein [Nanoarchaeota archaeon]